MRGWLLFVLGSLPSAGLAAFSWTWAQNPPHPATSQPPPTARPARDVARLPPFQQQMFRSAQRAADWLLRANRADGRFDYGYMPALKAKLEGDHYLRQAGAAFALARVSRLTGDERQADRAKQALLALLLETTQVDVANDQSKVRHTTLPSVAVNRLGAAGLLILAISEVPTPAEDLLEQAEESCRYVRRQQQPNGSLAFWDQPSTAPVAAPAGGPDGDPEGINYYPGEALYGLMRSQQQQKAAWKTDVVKKALAYYAPWWKKNKNMAFIPWQAGAYAEAYLATREPAFAEFVFEMTDWLCGLQYTALDPRHPLWLGGFMGWAEGKPATTAPQISSAAYAEGIAEACRVARAAGDLARYQRYRETLERCLQFLATLQYTDANTQHFADWYRPYLLGGFHASHEDGNLRIDYAQHSVCALVQYLIYVAD